MSRWQTDFIRRVGEVPGVLGCGLERSDRSKIVRSNHPDYAEASVEAALRTAADTFHVLRLHRQESKRLRWTFEKSFLYCCHKRDEAVLAVFTGKSLRLLDSTALERLFQEFQQRAMAAGER